MTNCSKEDYSPEIGPCIGGKANISYKLKSKICDNHLMKLSNKSINCFSCREGEKQIEKESSKCQKCKNGT